MKCPSPLPLPCQATVRSPRDSLTASSLAFRPPISLFTQQPGGPLLTYASGFGTAGPKLLPLLFWLAVRDLPPSICMPLCGHVPTFLPHGPVCGSQTALSLLVPSSGPRHTPGLPKLRTFCLHGRGCPTGACADMLSLPDRLPPHSAPCLGAEPGASHSRAAVPSGFLLGLAIGKP